MNILKIGKKERKTSRKILEPKRISRSNEIFCNTFEWVSVSVRKRRRTSYGVPFTALKYRKTKELANKTLTFHEKWKSQPGSASGFEQSKYPLQDVLNIAILER